MLSVAIHKDVGEYQPKIIGKLPIRTLVCIVGAVGMSLLTAAYITFVLGLQTSDFMVLIYAISIPFWLCGFMRPQGLKFEVFAKYWLEYNFITKHILYSPSFKLAGFDERCDHRKEGKVYDKELRKLANLPGIEAYSPKAGRVL